MSETTMHAKPSKPSPDFPLFPHNSGKWAKKIKGKTVYFGSWSDPDKALAEYSVYIAKQQEGPKSAAVQDVLGKSRKSLSVRYCCNLFLTHKADQVDSKENSARTFGDYRRTCARVVKFFGPDRAIESLGPNDFTSYKTDLAKRWNPVNVGNEATRIKTILKWLKSNRHTGDIDTGPDLRKPSRLVARRYRRSVGKKLFSAKEIHAVLNEAGVNMRAMILLGINCGFQNSDCELLTREQAMVAIATGWLDVPRSKTEVDRRCWLWKTTQRSLQRALAIHQNELAFVLPDGKPFSSSNCDIAKRFRAARDHAMIRVGGYSWLRKTFETVAGASKDQVAVDCIMGHVDASMAGVYRQEIQDDRLKDVSRVVYRWLRQGGAEN